MENSELVKQFEAVLYEDQVIIITPSNRLKGFEAKINVKHEIKIGWHDWIETDKTALNYHECCGILILFGITPPSFEELYGLLKS
jgi:hypothetical protein